MTLCPPTERLLLLLADAADSAERGVVEAHVDACAACQERLNRLIDEAGGHGETKAQLLALPAVTTVDLPSFLRTLQRNPPPLEEASGTAPTLRASPPPGGTSEPWPAIPGYEILGELSRGGQGVVYRARQVKANRVVALKVILAGGHAGAAELARFQTEAEALARLQHPNIVQVHEVGQYEGKPFFSMEYCGGGNLEKKLNHTPQPIHEAAELVETLARAIQVAHAESIIHRDLKPANVLLTADGTRKIADFGLAKKLDDVGPTQSGVIMGTLLYMAPEQARGKVAEVGPAADVYSLGAILYETLTGRPPFNKGATVLDTLVQAIADDPVPPRSLNRMVPRDLETICLKCLEKDAARRYLTAEQLAVDLRCFLNHEPLRYARSQTLIEWFRHALERHMLVNDVGNWANLTLAAGVWNLVEHGLMFWLIQSNQPVLFLWLCFLGVEAVSGTIFHWGLLRRSGTLSSREQEMRILWVANSVAHLCLFWILCPPFGDAQAADALRYYPCKAAVHGLTFFVEGRLFRGWLYLVGLGFFAAALLIPLKLEWSPLLYGAWDAAVLFSGGLYLRRLANREAVTEGAA